MGYQASFGHYRSLLFLSLLCVFVDIRSRAITLKKFSLIYQSILSNNSVHILPIRLVRIRFMGKKLLTIDNKGVTGLRSTYSVLSSICCGGAVGVSS